MFIINLKMNLNSQQGQLDSYHKTYTACLSSQFNNWMNGASSDKGQEWCAKEKNDYLQYMRVHLPVQYENLMRVEEHNI